MEPTYENMVATLYAAIAEYDKGFQQYGNYWPAVCKDHPATKAMQEASWALFAAFEPHLDEQSEIEQDAIAAWEMENI